jgi:hypothetical protein
MILAAYSHQASSQSWRARNSPRPSRPLYPRLPQVWQPLRNFSTFDALKAVAASFVNKLQHHDESRSWVRACGEAREHGAAELAHGVHLVWGSACAL